MTVPHYPVVLVFLLVFVAFGGKPQQRPSANVQGAVTLNLNGPRSPYWTIDASSIHIFLHPTLRELKISCATLLDSLAGYIGKEKLCSTALKTLTLEECNITGSGLQSILSLPKALEALRLGMFSFHSREVVGTELYFNYRRELPQPPPLQSTCQRCRWTLQQTLQNQPKRNNDCTTATEALTTSSHIRDRRE